jgi:hypothetical protein
MLAEKNSEAPKFHPNFPVAFLAQEAVLRLNGWVLAQVPDSALSDEVDSALPERAQPELFP